MVRLRDRIYYVCTQCGHEESILFYDVSKESFKEDYWEIWMNQGMRDISYLTQACSNCGEKSFEESPENFNYIEAFDYDEAQQMHQCTIGHLTFRLSTNPSEMYSWYKIINHPLLYGAIPILRTISKDVFHSSDCYYGVFSENELRYVIDLSSFFVFTKDNGPIHSEDQEILDQWEREAKSMSD